MNWKVALIQWCSITMAQSHVTILQYKSRFVKFLFTLKQDTCLIKRCGDNSQARQEIDKWHTSSVLRSVLWDDLSVLITLRETLWGFECKVTWILCLFLVSWIQLFKIHRADVHVFTLLFYWFIQFLLKSEMNVCKSTRSLNWHYTV